MKPIHARHLLAKAGLIALAVCLIAIVTLAIAHPTKVLATGTSLPDVAMNGGDTQHLGCTGPGVSVGTSSTSLNGPSAADFSCIPATTTTTMATTTTTTTGAGGSAPTVDQTSHIFGLTPQTTASIANSTAELAVAFVSSDCNYPSHCNTGSPAMAETVTGGSLTWTKQANANTRPGLADIWSATTAGTAFTATATANVTGQNLQLTVITFSGSSGIGATVNTGATASAPSISVTPQATSNSLIYGVGFDFDHATARTIGSGQTQIEGDTDVAGDTYWLQKVTAATTTGSAVTVNDTAPTGDQWDMAGVEVKGTGGGGGTSVAVDNSSPAFVQAPANVASMTTAAFSPPAATVLYAVFSMDSCPTGSMLSECTLSGDNMDVSSMASTGTTLTWHEVALDQASVTNSIGGFVEVFYADNTSAQSGITVTGNFSVHTKNVTAPTGGMKLYVMDNAKADQSTSAETAGYNVTGTSAPSESVTTTAANSLVFGVFDNWDSATAPTVPAGEQVLDSIANATDADYYWIQDETAITATSATVVTQNDTAPSIHWHEIAWEVKAA